jgi:hypothetical protein
MKSYRKVMLRTAAISGLLGGATMALAQAGAPPARPPRCTP